MELPDLTGQPGWVVVTVMLLFLLGVLGVTYLRRTGRRDEEEQKAQIPPSDDARAVPSSSTGSEMSLVQAALDHMARTADRESRESEEARRESAELRRQLHECGVGLAAALDRASTAERELVACRAQAELLSRQAFRRGSHGDTG